MTLRLVCLMSVVLLVSLAAFGLLTAHYQDQVMEEVARTASTVGRATLRTFEMEGTPAFQMCHGSAALAGGVIPSHAWVTVNAFDVSDEDAPPAGVLREVTRLRIDGPGARTVEEIHELRRHMVVEDIVEGETADAGAPATWVQEMRFIVDVDRVTAESDPDRGLILKIPRFVRESVPHESDDPDENRFVKGRQMTYEL